MKRIIAIVATSVLVLCLLVPVVALGMDVDIDIVADDVNVDIGITGDNNEVKVNGEVPFRTYYYWDYYNDAWIKDWTVEKEAELQEICDSLGITTDGLAYVIQLAQLNNQSIAELLADLVAQGKTLAQLVQELDSTEAGIQARSSSIDASLASTQTKINSIGSVLRGSIDDISKRLSNTDNILGETRNELVGAGADLEQLSIATSEDSAELRSNIEAKTSILAENTETNRAYAEYLTGRVNALVGQYNLGLKVIGILVSLLVGSTIWIGSLVASLRKQTSMKE